VNDVAKRTKPASIEVVESPDGRFVIATFADGTVIRKAVDPTERPKRKPRKPVARARNPKRDFATKVSGSG
jgi:hypothetical protein